jgi:geranyl-CoA carboxylase beta subunit
VPVLTSLLDTGSAAFAANAARMAERLAEVRALEQKVREESSSKRDRFEKRGQLLPRERVARLIDRGSDFIEFATLAGLGMHDDDGKTNRCSAAAPSSASARSAASAAW